MNADELHRTLRRNVVSQYAALAFQMVRGLIVFRLLFQSLSKEQFGYWALLWSVLGYGILLDFGFGLSVQKAVAQLSARRDWKGLNRHISTLFYSYCAIGLALILVAMMSAGLWVRAMGVSEQSSESFKQIFVMFVGTMGLMLPLGLFPCILRGQQRISLSNWLGIAGSGLSLVAICLALHFDASFRTIFVLALLGSLFAPVASIVAVVRSLPGLRLSLNDFSRDALKELSAFSAMAYFIMVSYIIMTKTDLLVIGTFLGVQAAVIYQPGAKVAEMFSSATKQLAAAIQPAAAHLYAKGDVDAVRRLLGEGIRVSALLATPLYLGCAFYLPTLLQLLTGEAQPDRQTVLVGQLLLLWSYSYSITHAVYQQVAIMGGHERKLVRSGILETTLNVGISVALVQTGLGVSGVALGTLIPALGVGWFVLFRWAAKEARVSSWEFFKRTLARNILAAVPLLLLLAIGHELGYTDRAQGTVAFTAFLLLAVASAILLFWTLAITAHDRSRLAARLSRPLRRWTGGPE